MKSSLFKNLRLQTYLQVVNTIIPLITTPYIARVLGSTKLGIFSYTTSVASFFTLFAMLGTINYGTRAIATETDKEKRKSIFAEIYILQLATCVIATVCYSGYFLFCRENRLMVFLQLITLVGYMFDVSWFYFGVENFSFTVRCNLFFRILGVASLFIFVKDEGDLWIYTVIMLASAALSHLVLWINLLKDGGICFKGVNRSNIFKHIKPNVILFVPLVAMTVYHSTDKLMLGVFSTYEQTGYYYNVDKVINVPLAVFTGIGTVLLPRMTVLFQQDREKAKAFFFDGLSGIMMLGTALCFGIIAIAQEFIPLFLGKGYTECIMLIMTFAPIVIVKCISNAIRMQYLIPQGQESIYIKATVVGAIINVILNFFLIPQYGAMGAEITTIVSEVAALAIQIVFMCDKRKLIRTASDLLIYVILGIIMVLIVRPFNGIISNAFLLTTVKAVVGGVSYCLLTLLFWIITKNPLYVQYIKGVLRKSVKGN
ncbi:MAG: flippase [Lachnospiraceae bacterium]|nr:flippase [Lachnospiraceae bacterium]